MPPLRSRTVVLATIVSCKLSGCGIIGEAGGNPPMVAAGGYQPNGTGGSLGTIVSGLVSHSMLSGPIASSSEVTCTGAIDCSMASSKPLAA